MSAEETEFAAKYPYLASLTTGSAMVEPDYNSYQITVTVRDISKRDALDLAAAFEAKARMTRGKDTDRIPEDVEVTVAHVKLWTEFEDE